MNIAFETESFPRGEQPDFAQDNILLTHRVYLPTINVLGQSSPKLRNH